MSVLTFGILIHHSDAFHTRLLQRDALRARQNLDTTRNLSRVVPASDLDISPFMQHSSPDLVCLINDPNSYSFANRNLSLRQDLDHNVTATKESVNQSAHDLEDKVIRQSPIILLV